MLSKISFCDKQCSNVNDNKFKAQIIQNLDSKYKIQVVTRDYNILNPNILRNVSYHQHILSTYSNGNPYMLYLTKIDGINCSLFIDKKLKDGYSFPKMHCVKYRFADELFRVYANKFPDVELVPKNMTNQVEKMWLRAVSPRTE